MSSDDTAIRAMAEAILEAHAPTFTDGPAIDVPVAPSTTTHFTSEDPVYRAAQQACTALGFIAIDAECLARAWQAQTHRIGRFEAARWPDTPVDFGLAPWPRADAFPAGPRRLGLYAVLPDAAWVARMARAGVPTLQLRFKSDDAQAVRREVQAAVAAVRGTQSLLFINDHWRAAIEAGAYGVHLGQEDLDALTPAELATLRHAGLRLGVSTHGYAEMLRADACSPSYVAMGAVFPTTLKKMATAPQGTARLKAYARLMREHSLVAIGGIDAERFPAVLESGVGSVAVVRAIVAAPDPEAAARQLMARLPTQPD
ncbi:thiamine phosphate synthase [Rhodoferax koreense]|uniref:Thiamine phosphate synthase n=1 Tax=Rhodoferax koreensis TaxID=1842727 RepID=A0A1P8JXU2_9BURK|nr:thiamine phosphate synthase [Rhodoferax koreense]APW38511.1 thiamine phosphate synthase [Rhodoferax koreense]